MKPPMIYYGGKVSIAETITRFLPPHQHYIEPFAGGLSVLLAKKPSRTETVNDLDGDLMTFWRVLRDQPKQLNQVCQLTPHSRGEYLASFNKETADEVEVARRVWVQLTQGRGGTLTRTGWRYFTAAGNGVMADYLDAYRARLIPAAERIKNVSLECRPALEVIQAYGNHSDSLLYVDPPYLGVTRNSRGYRHEMRSAEEHEELAAALTKCKAAVILSGYPSPVYDATLKDWYTQTLTTITGNAPSNKTRTEKLWSNLPIWNQMQLWEKAA